MAQVYKFGGASVKNAEGVRNVEKIVRMAEGDLMVVVSAMGKTTNALERVVEALAAGQEEKGLQQWVDIIDFHVAIMKELGLQPGVDIRLQGEIPYDPATRTTTRLSLWARSCPPRLWRFISSNKVCR